MKRGVIEKIIVQTRPQLEAMGVTHLALFGSRARGDNTQTSDLDVLIEVDRRKPFSLIDLVGVQRILSDALGLDTQATMRRSLPIKFGKAIEDDTKEVF